LHVDPRCRAQDLRRRSPTTDKVEVDDGVYVYGHVNLNDGRQGQSLGRRQPGARASARIQDPLFDTFQPPASGASR
jgi:hypothetical protein